MVGGKQRGVAVSRVEAPGLSPLSLHVGGIPKDSSGKRPVTPPTLPLSTYCTHTHTHTEVGGGVGAEGDFALEIYVTVTE